MLQDALRGRLISGVQTKTRNRVCRWHDAAQAIALGGARGSIGNNLEGFPVSACGGNIRGDQGGCRRSREAHLLKVRDREAGIAYTSGKCIDVCDYLAQPISGRAATNWLEGFEVRHGAGG